MRVKRNTDESHGRTAKRPKDWCPLFDLLTFDLRWHIYQLAFPARVVHLYLLYGRMLQSEAHWRKGHRPLASWIPHSPGAVSAVDPLSSGNPDAGAGQSPRWHWWSCACGLDEEAGLGGAPKHGMEMALPDPCPMDFSPRPSEEGLREKTFLGVMGWLTSCRQAYEETINLLYISTTFKLEQRLQALYFPYALPQPQRSWVTSLYVRINDYDESMIDPRFGDAPAPTPMSQPPGELRRLSGREKYQRILATVAASFPGLRRLHVTFEGSARPGFDPDDPHPTKRIVTTTVGDLEEDELESVLLGPLDSFPAVVQRQVIFFPSIYDVLLQAAREKQPVDEETFESPGGLRSGWTRFWRRLDREQCERGGYWIYQHKWRRIGE
ncbi:hypothetical protein ACRALDRAFT_1078024 [Sodiomyces alcalophilus JCM 7366]|uniref:uncharacterized protein n=1 Tax=Sodiomyces alcalophilus JCM 7366 TaxID=591952 RepID=UPI0039B69EDA